MKRLWNFITLYDKILILSLTLSSIIFIILPFLGFNKDTKISEQVIVIQSSDGTQIKIQLADTYKEEPLLIKVSGPIGTHIIQAHNGKVRIKEAPEADPHKICAKTGWISQSGPMIICVPNQLSIWIEKNNSEFDGVSW